MLTAESPGTLLNRYRFLKLALLVQGGVLVLAIAAGYGLGKSPGLFVFWSPASAIAGLLAVLPMLGLFRISPGLRRLAMDSLGESLSQCRWYDLVLLAALAGVGEELLFRGVLFDGLARWNKGLAIIGSNVAFGALHALSRNYFLAATAIGLAMHALAEATGPRNLLAPMIAHGVYDLVAFVLLVREWKVKHSLWHTAPQQSPT